MSETKCRATVGGNHEVQLVQLFPGNQGQSNHKPGLELQPLVLWKGVAGGVQVPLQVMTGPI